MHLRVPLAAALVVVAAVAGCVAPPSETLAPASLLRAPATALLSETTEWTAKAGLSEVATFDVPAGAGAIFAQWTASTAGPSLSPAFELLAESPAGETITVGAASGRTGFERGGWNILPGEAGAWTFSVDATADVAGELVLTAMPAREPLQRVAGTGADRVVVAVVDTGINPYHEVFRAAALGTADLPARIVEAETGLPPASVPIAVGEDYLSSVAADAALWAVVPSQTLVHFSGTNVLGYQLGETALPSLPVLDRAGHGTGVAHTVVRENPDALVVLITGDDYDAGVRWAAAQPWIDLISLSWGPPVNAAGATFDKLGFFATPEATREAWLAGKVIFTASGNDPTPTFSDTTSGPIWAHAVAGAESEAHGRAPISGNLVDTIANFTQELANYDSLDEVHWTAGTSFATPTTAGVASRILHEVRAKSGHVGGITEGALVKTETVTVTNGDLRHALNATAMWWSTTDYGGPTNEALPILPAPWATMGWGVVDGTIVAPAAAALLGEGEWPEKPAEAKAFMDANARLRESWWP